VITTKDTRDTTIGLSLRSCLILCILGVLGGDSSSQVPTIFGFTARSSPTERTHERRFIQLPAAARIREAHAFLTAEPHVAGTPRDRLLAEWVRDRWNEYGLDRVEMSQHDVLLPYGDDVRVEMGAWRASLKEDAIAGDPFSARDVGPAYHAYSASADVTAPIVYAHSGNPEDYDWLLAHGVDIKGKIALVRYSVPYSYRGFKALTAEQRGAAGILIYSDPAEDGFRKGKVYPDGPWGNESHIQRGGTVYDFRVPGDPLTPGWASVPGAKRIDARDAISLPKIASAPLSWRDARVILASLTGPVAPPGWQGGITNLTYHVGPGATPVHLKVHNDDKVRPIWTVTGRITGTSSAADLVIVGNHRDAWVYGGVDPSSGSASLMELARSLGALARQGARPKRTIVFASWDAEEFTLTSSTEWGEEHERELTDHAVAYLNVDMAVSGPAFDATAVPSLNRLVTEAANDALGAAAKPLEVKNRLGSGSDYTVFLNFLGIPVADFGFTGPYGVYHSIYDNHLWMSKVGDPDFSFHTALVRVWGVMALRLANADVVPLDPVAYASRLREFANETIAHAAPADRGVVQPLTSAIERFAAAAQQIARRAERADPTQLSAINSALMQMERAFLDRDGIPSRPWYRHLIYAPQPTYAAEVLPGVTEAIAARDRARLTQQVARLVAAIDRATTRIH
jgi:N-acetylated-alpha-linked acidic dipeptidase